jgi:hypothetical protein
MARSARQETQETQQRAEGQMRRGSRRELEHDGEMMLRLHLTRVGCPRGKARKVGCVAFARSQADGQPEARAYVLAWTARVYS